MPKHNGIVASYDRQYDHGIIATEHNEYWFSHKSILMDGYRYATPGDRVSFDVGVKGDRLIAVDVTIKH